jgi:hypothetical protein
MLQSEDQCLPEWLEGLVHDDQVYVKQLVANLNAVTIRVDDCACRIHVTSVVPFQRRTATDSSRLEEIQVRLAVRPFLKDQTGRTRARTITAVLPAGLPVDAVVARVQQLVDAESGIGLALPAAIVAAAALVLATTWIVRRSEQYPLAATVCAGNRTLAKAAASTKQKEAPPVAQDDGGKDLPRKSSESDL